VRVLTTTDHQVVGEPDLTRSCASFVAAGLLVDRCTGAAGSSERSAIDPRRWRVRVVHACDEDRSPAMNDLDLIIADHRELPRLPEHRASRSDA
jgi:hypothetical protein